MFFSLLTVLGALALGTISPGPSFVMVARTAVARSRAEGVAAAFGMGTGGLVFASAALLGLQALFKAVPLLYLAFKVLGGLYLLYIGYQIWQGAAQPLALADDTNPIPTAGTRQRAYWLGLSTQLSNPKTAIAYAGIFASLLPAEMPVWVSIMLLSLIFCLETGWYAIVSIVLSSEGPRRTYLRFKVWIDRMAGGVIALLGLNLVLKARMG